MRVGVVSVRSIILFIAVMLFGTGALYAQCGGSITSMEVSDPPNQESAQISVGYALTGGGNIAITRRDDSTGSEAWAGGGNVSGTGTFVGNSFFSCTPPGAYTYKAVLTPDCNPPVAPDIETVTRTYDTRPTASGSILGFNADKTVMTVKLDYSFPYVRESSGTGNRRLYVYIDGVPYVSTYAFYLDPWEGSKTFDIGISCLGSGTHTVTFRATVTPCYAAGCVCLESVSTAAPTFTIQQADITSVSIEPTGDGRNFLATVGYRFEATPTDSRGINLYFNGQQYLTGAPCCEATGTFTKEFEFQSCLPSGTYTFTAQAVACRRPNDPQFTDVQTVPVSIPAKKGSITIDKLLDTSMSDIKLKVTHALPPGITSATRTVHVLEMVGDNGISIPGGVIRGPETVTTSTPTELEFSYSPPLWARSIKFLATLAFCNGQADAVTTWSCVNGCDAQPKTATNHPISFEDGNAGYSDSDPLPPLLDSFPLTRQYDSQHRVLGAFGRGWVSMFDSRLFVLSNSRGDTISLSDEQNSAFIFLRRNGQFSQLWPMGGTGAGSLTLETATGLYVHRPVGATTVRLYRAGDGRFAGYRHLGTGREMRIEYDAGGAPATVNDSWTDVTWTITANASTKRITSITSAGLTWQYLYTNDNLTSVLAPGGAQWRTYEYLNNLMTAARDSLGNLIEGHTYDASGRAIGESGPAEIDSVQYAAPGTSSTQLVTRVTMKSGAVTEATLRPIGNSWRTVKITGGCTSCGARDAVYAYDADGHLIREQDANGYVSVRSYANARLQSLQTHLKPAGCNPETSPTHCMLDPDALVTASLEATPSTLTSTYEYGDPLWPDKATAIVTPSIVSSGGSRREVFAYHPSTGAITTHSITGWNESVAQETHTTSTSFYGDANSFAPAFDPGGTFQPAWLALPQPPLRRSVDGPRTDVADVAAFVYYPVDSSVTPATLRGRVAAVRNAAGQITRYQGYDSFGNATRVVDANGVASEMTFDALGRVVLSTLKGIPGCDTSKDPLCGSDLTTSRAYASQAGPVQSEERPAGGVTVYEYDSHGRVQSLSRGPAANDLRERIEYTYDPLSGLKSVERFFARENAAWIEKRSESYGYDSLGQLQTATHADGTSVGYTYDRLGRVATVRDENHAAANSSYSYDPAGRIASVRQTLTGAPNGFITTGYSYDLHGNLTRVVDPNGNATDYHYDDFGRMVSQQSPVTGTTQYRYDPAGNMTFTQDANGATTQRTYDVLGRVTSSISTKGASGETITWTYDSPVAGDFASGRLSSMNDPSGSTSYVYDRRGSLRQEIKTIDGSSYTTGYQYDADANRALIRYPSGRTVTYTYDFAGRPQSASTGSTALVTSTRYLPFGPVSEIVYGNGTTKTMQYDSRYRVMQNGLVGPAGTIAAYDYAYDAVGNVTQLHDSTNPAFNRDFAYDDLNRLTTANSGSSLWGSGSYAYDRMGNLLSSALGANRQSSFVYSGTTPKITAATENGIPRSITYDAAGNESVVGAASFAYSPRNHLVAGDGLNYAYDGRGVRVATSYPAVAIASLTVSPSTLYTNQTATGTVTLGAAAPAGGAVVSLTSSNPALIVPATITVPAGGTTAIFGIALAANMSSGGAVITANYYLKRTAAVTLISGPALSSIVVNPATLAGGSTAQGTITLQGPAPSVGAVVMLSSSHSAVGVPSTVTIPANETTATFTVSSLPVSASASSTITATYNGTSTATVTVSPAKLTAITIEPQTVMGGHSALGTVTLDGLAVSDITVTLTSSNPQAVTVAATVVIPAGTASRPFTILTSASVSSPISVTITGTADSITRSATLTVTACIPATAAAPSIQAGDTVWIDDETPAGATMYGSPVWDAAQKASGTKSVTKPLQSGAWEMGFVGATSTMPVYYNENLVFYALLSECVPPTRITVQWRTTDGVYHNALWGVAHPAFPTIGPVPAAGGWVRFEVPARQLNMEGKTVDSVFVGGLDGQAWFDRFGKGGTACIPAAAAPPTIPSGDTVWIDDETPAGATIYGSPVWDATQKASGTKSVTKPFQMGPWDIGFIGATTTMPVHFNENLVFYALLSECVPPSRITVQWKTTDGVYHNALWGVPHTAFPAPIGPLPAAGGWVRFEVSARQLNMEGKTVDSVFVGGLDGQAWFDHFGKSGTACIPATAPPPTIPSGDTVWIDDDTPAGATLYQTPVWDATQKASGTKSVTKPFQMGPWEMGFVGATSTMPVYYNENMVFYALLSECTPPSRITVQWRTTDGVYHNALWGVAHPAFPTIGPLPAAGGWVRFVVPARQLNMEGKSVDSVFVGGLDGQAWFDHFGKSGPACNPSMVPPPSIPGGDTVWIDDETPAGATLYNQPVWDAAQKASGAKSLTKPFQLGAWETGLVGATATMPVYTGENVVFYALLNVCVPPSRITIQWRTTDGVYHNALWGTPHPAFPTIGPLPAAGSWARFEVSARQLNLEGKSVDSVFVGGLDGQAWFDRFGKAPVQPVVLTSLSPDRVSPQMFGTAITWTAHATGGVSPLEYRFLARKESIGVNNVVRDWSASNTYVWTPGSNDVGGWQIHVHVRSAGATQEESYRVASYMVTIGEPAVVTALTPDKPSPQPVGTTVLWTAQVTGGVAPLQYRFLERDVDVGVNNVVQDWSTLNTYQWTRGLGDVGDWQIHVHVRSTGAIEVESYLVANYKLTVGAPAVVTALTPDQASPRMQGTPITWTAQASGGVGPLEYRFLARKESIGVNNIVRDWSTSNTYVWTPGPNDIGSWQIHVHVRSAGATQEESYRVASYMVTIGEPAVVTALTPDKPSSQPAGTTVVWTAQVTGGVAPLQYRFLERDVDVGVNNVVQDWSTSNTYYWTRGLSDVGDWIIHVHVRSAGATEVESYRIAGFTLTAAPAVLTGFTANKTSPQPAGAAITWTATAVGSVQPLQYRFERRDDGVWHEVQAYSSSNTYSWTPAASDAGDHAVRVSVRNAGSTAEFEDIESLDMQISTSTGSLITKDVPVALSITARYVETTSELSQKYSLYTPELSLLAETETTTTATPAIAYEYVWFGGQPLAQIETGTGAVSYYFNDHLGTPLLQTAQNAEVVWRAEYEPYGTVYAFRAGTGKHQPLRFPGQESDGDELSYNIFRWYRAGWGRYSQADPIGLSGGANLYGYGAQNPENTTDRLGLFCSKSDWVKHYYSGKGATINLADVGLLNAFIGTVNVQGMMKSERVPARNVARELARKLCRGCNKGTKGGLVDLTPDKTYLNFEHTPCFYAIGSTFLRTEKTNCLVAADCGTRQYAYSCYTKYALRDEFSNPLSFGFEFGGVPYDIIADWYDRFNGNGSF